MIEVRCPICKKTTGSYEKNYNGTLQCYYCAEILRIEIKNGLIVNVGLRKYNLDIPSKIPDDLKQVLNESVKCFEIDCNIAAVVIAGVFTEALFKHYGFKGDILYELIKDAHEKKAISDFVFHASSACRYLRNSCAHFSKESSQIKSSDARIVIELVRNMSEEIVGK